MGKPRRETVTTLPDLPNAIIIRIAEKLPVKDLPSLASCCRGLASMADELYASRHVLDMSCFEPATLTPALCDQLLARFSSARLQKLVFRYDLRGGGGGEYDEERVEAIVGRFLGNVNPWKESFQRDLRSGTPPPLHLLAHSYYLHSFLSSHPSLRSLDLDLELSLFTVPSSRGPRLDWHLLNPFVTLHQLPRLCPSLESYSARSSSYQMPHVDLLHLHLNFLRSCTRLRHSSLVFVLGPDELAAYARLLPPRMALHNAVFHLPGWRLPPETEAEAEAEARRLIEQRLSRVAGSMESLRKAVVSFRRRGCLGECRGLFTGLPMVESFYLRCDFNPRYPVCDIDDAPGVFFGDLFSNLIKEGETPASLRRLLLWGVPEDEFEMLFRGVLPKQVVEIRVQLHWYSPLLDHARQTLLDRFLNRAPHLRTFCIAGVPPVPPEHESQASPVFVRAKNWKPAINGVSCMFIFSGGKRRSSFQGTV